MEIFVDAYVSASILVLQCYTQLIQTGYKPILEAAKTFILEDLKGELIEENNPSPLSAHEDDDGLLQTPANGSGCGSSSSGSCGRPGGCCRDPSTSSSGSSADRASSQESVNTRATSVGSGKPTTSSFSFIPYNPTAEIIFPPALWKYEERPICYGDGRKIWFKPTTLEQLMELKDAWPSAKIVGGASETQVRSYIRSRPTVLGVSYVEIDRGSL